MNSLPKLTDDVWLRAPVAESIAKTVRTPEYEDRYRKSNVGCATSPTGLSGIEKEEPVAALVNEPSP
jgi:hypothetical protein